MPQCPYTTGLREVPPHRMTIRIKEDQSRAQRNAWPRVRPNKTKLASLTRRLTLLRETCPEERNGSKLIIKKDSSCFLFFLSIQTCLQRGLIKMFNFFLQSCWTKASYSLSYVIHLINLYCNKPGDTTKPQCCSKPNLSSISSTRKVFRSESHTV